MVPVSRPANRSEAEFMSENMKTYIAMIWEKDSNKSGRRVSTSATNLDEAKEKLELEYGKGNVFDLHNEDDANRIR